jgi:predicted deacetylase
LRPAETGLEQIFIAMRQRLRQARRRTLHDMNDRSPPTAMPPGHTAGSAVPARRLLVSIHDVSPRSEHAVDALAERLERHLGSAGFAMLIIPDHWREAPIAGNAAFHARLRQWAGMGIEMFLHGWCHRDETPAPQGLAAFKGRHMTAGEGEFLSLSRAEATQRMRAGKMLLEDILGTPVAGFIAPAWLYGPGALAALDDLGFAIAEDHFKVWAPGSRRVLSRGPVVTWASRSPGRIRSSLGFAALARRVLPAVLPTLRVAVHPGDITVPALLGSIDATLARFAASHRPARYAGLLV